MMKFDEMPMEDQAKGMQAVREFLMNSDYTNIEDAADDLDCHPRKVWDGIMADADLPECEPPEFIEAENLKQITPEEALDSLSLPKYIPLPEPGQSIEDDDCEWMALDIATVSDVETFLAAVPDALDLPGFMSLQFLVGVAKQAKAKPDENLMAVAGMITRH